MTGRNLFESTQNFAKAASAGPQPGVFISHSSLDKPRAREVAAMLKAIRIDYYFDEDDEELQRADRQRDHHKVVQRIHHGLMTCTHLLGLISDQTKRSWWVPYEIGHATGLERKCAHLVEPGMTTVPSFIQAASVIVNQQELKSWLPVDDRSTKSASDRYYEAIAGTGGLANLVNFSSVVPTEGSAQQLTYY